MKIYTETLSFLKNLKVNNDRNWFNENKDQYTDSLKNVEEVIQEIIGGLKLFNKEIPHNLEAKKCLFRIYRDARFSKDKSPYKSWFGAAMGRDGRKTAAPIYYFHIEPAKSFIALGYWRPEKDHLKMIRAEIDYNLELFENSLKKAQKFGWSKLDNSESLKKAPQSYEAENPAIEYLKNKSFILSIDLTDEELTSNELIPFILNKFAAGDNFMNFLNEALVGEADFSEEDLRNLF